MMCVWLTEVLARKKAGEDKFAHRPVTSYFRLGKQGPSSLSFAASLFARIPSRGGVLTSSRLHVSRTLPHADMDKVRAQLPTNCPPSLVELAVQSAAYDVEDRPDAEAILGWIDDLYASWPEDECPEPPLPNFPDFPLPDVVRIYR